MCDVTAHAEMQAITSAANKIGEKYLTDCTLYVTVEPCVMCAGAIGWAQIPRIVFGAYDEKLFFRCYVPKAMHPKAEIIGGVLEEECAALMTDFFANLRKLRMKNSSLFTLHFTGMYYTCFRSQDLVPHRNQWSIRPL